MFAGIPQGTLPDLPHRHVADPAINAAGAQKRCVVMHNQFAIQRQVYVQFDAVSFFSGEGERGQRVFRNAASVQSAVGVVISEEISGPLLSSRETRGDQKQIQRQTQDQPHAQNTHHRHPSHTNKRLRRRGQVIIPQKARKCNRLG